MNQPGKPDFSNASGRVASSEPGSSSKPSFDNVRGGVRSTEQPVAGHTHTVVQGDTLSHIAQQVYGNAGRWRAIFDANRDQLDDPDRILPGQLLRLPMPDSE